MAHEGLHEDPALLGSAVMNQHRAIESLMEELEAIDWYSQRAQACDDDGLKAILTHNMNDEMEHAAMLLEWIRREIPHFNAELTRFFNTKGPIAPMAKD
jgi:hypothetical protein